LLVYSRRGYCAEAGGKPECRYPSKDVNCIRGCQQTGCADEPWIGAECSTPPARYCQSDTLLAWQTMGRFVDGKCEYTKKVIECEKGCVEGRCVDELLCPHLTCDAPPAAHCLGDALRVFDDQGICDEENGGFCLYPSQDLACENGCEAGRCVDQPCRGVSCDDPPVSACLNADTFLVWNGTASCDQTTGACDYGTADIQCADGCVGGACQGDLCAGVVCTSQPASYCLDPNTLRSYQERGTCRVESDDQAVCSYPYDDINCPDGCSAGWCRGNE
jgi:hypothetical protein